MGDGIGGGSGAWVLDGLYGCVGDSLWSVRC